MGEIRSTNTAMEKTETFLLEKQYLRLSFDGGFAKVLVHMPQRLEGEPAPLDSGLLSPLIKQYAEIVAAKTAQLQSEGKLPYYDEPEKWTCEHDVLAWRIAEETGVELGLWEPLPSFIDWARKKGLWSPEGSGESRL